MNAKARQRDALGVRRAALGRFASARDTTLNPHVAGALERDNLSFGSSTMGLGRRERRPEVLCGR